ncbi:MAG: sigma-70 family RNA polymerase sigma factor [Actinomycetota bacterium]|nr:sigma-70 family RNA polymerase sigma factor [Actinomycetota bacterium]PLS76285.1 MAG: RNA polymerase subunit sigma [Actinomycetota bacterium]
MRISMNQSDTSFAVASGEGWPGSIEWAYKTHAGAVQGMAQQLLASKVRAEDVVQEVFLRMWSSPEKFDADRGSLRSYLLAQSRGRALDQLRSDVARARREGRSVLPGTSTDPGFETSLCHAETASELHRALASLPVAQQEPIALAYFGGYSYREVASLLEVAEGTVKSRIRAGLRHLRAALGAEGLEDGARDRTPVLSGGDAHA